MGARDEIKSRKEAIQGVRDQITELERLKETQLELSKSTKLTKEEWGAIKERVRGYDKAIQKSTQNINQMSKDVNKVEQGLQKAEARLDSFSEKIQKQIKKIPVLGDSFAEGIQAGTDKAKKLMDKWLTSTDKGMRRKFKILGAIMAGLLLGGIIAIWKVFQNLLGKAKETMMEMSTAINETARTIQMSTKDVKAYGKGVGDWVRYGSGWATSIAQIRDDMGYLPDLTSKENKLIGRLATNAGLGANEIANMYRHSQSMGKSLDQYVKDQEKKINNLNLEMGLNTTQAEIVKEIAGASDATLAMFGKQNAELERQVLIGKKIGLNLNQQASMAKSLLDIESSIESEMEARVLTGKELNFDKARELALNGDISGASKEIMDQVGGIAEFQEMNIIQKEALAKAAGMEVGALQKSLEMQAGIGDQAKLGGAGGAGGGLDAAAGNIDMTGEDASRKKRWGSIFQKTAENLRKLKKAVEDRLIKWFETGKGKDLVTGVETFVGDITKWLTGEAPAPKWWTDFQANFIIPVKAWWANWGTTLKNIAIALGVGGILKKGWDLVTGKWGKLGTKSNPMHVTMGGLGLNKTMSKLSSWLSAGPKGGWRRNLKAAALKMKRKATAPFKAAKNFIVKGASKIKDKAKNAAKKAGSFFKRGLGKVGGFFSKIGGGIAKAAKSVKGVVTKIGGKVAAKGLGKSLLKKIPGVGALAGIGFGISRALKGDFSGAAMEVASGLLSTIPGAGTAASVALDAGLLAKDLTSGASQVDPAPVEELSDFIYSPKFGAKKFRQDDLVVGGTKLDNALGRDDNKMLEQMVKLLGTLIQVCREDRVMSVDGKELATALASTQNYRGVQ